MDEQDKRLCPFFKDECKQEMCMLWRGSEESMIKKCAFAVIAEQLDILATRDGGKASFL